LFGATADCEPLAPNRLRWDPPADLQEGKDFVDGLVTMLHAREPEALEGCAVHFYRADRSMERVFVDADGELLIFPSRAGFESRPSLAVSTSNPAGSAWCRGE
jgi:homogentisate 1,2-dioxygenase